jgi:uncharacterized protein (DUF2164 family)
LNNVIIFPLKNDIDKKDAIQTSNEAFSAAEHIIDLITYKGGVHFYEQYIDTKRKKHCLKRLLQSFAESTQVIIFIGF